VILRKRRKIAMAEKLKPFGLPVDPLCIIRCQYRYENQDYFILADFELKFKDDNDDTGVSYANYSKYNYIEDELHQDNPPILQATILADDFRKMIENEGYEEHGKEFIVCR
jgi:hypothetical protein